jgi:hypothetical protein
MHCKICNYPLWQLAVRQCPECGTAFKPSDFEFTLNAVRFCCPHCEQAYYGTGPSGHLVPRAFNCVSCGKAVDMDEMVLLPTEGVQDHQTTATSVSWANRRDKGWFKAFFITMGNAMGNPNRAMDAVPEGGSATLAIVYMAIHVIPQALLSGMLFFMMVFGMVVARTKGGPTLGMFALAGLMVFAAPIAVLALAFIAHVLLAMTGTTLGLKRTVQAVCYSAGNNFICDVPCLGFYFCWVGGLWWAISGGFMLARAHRIKAWRAAIATVIPALLVVAVVVGSFAAMVYGISTTAASMTAASMPAMPSMHATSSAAGTKVAQVLTMPGQARHPHPGELLLGQVISAQELLLPGSASDTVACSVQNLTLNELGYDYNKLEENRQILLKDPALGGPACRVGDFVFTYAGIADPAPDPNLWLAIGWPDPTLNPKDPSDVVLVLPNGQSSVIDTAGFAAALDAQNDLRKANGLAALPHPRTVFATSKKTAYPRIRNYPSGAGNGPGGNGGNGGGQTNTFGGANDINRVNSLSGAIRGVNKPTRHVAELMASDSFGAFEFMDSSEFSDGGQIRRMTRIPFGNTTLRDYSKMDAGAKREQEKAAAAGLDDKTIAYRIGDTVFTHRGIDPSKVPYGSKQHGLWTLIAWPAAMKIEETDPDRRIYVGLADGSSRSFRMETFDQELANQNALRAEFGLEPLPSPEEVTQDAPAIGNAVQKMKVP